MTELSEARAGTAEQGAADATASLAEADRRAVHFLFGAQRLMLDELVFVSDEMLDRARTEAHLFTEFVATEFFGIAWFVKGETLGKMKAAAQRLPFIRHAKSDQSATLSQPAVDGQ